MTADFPYVRRACCELCGQPVAEDRLRRVVLREAEKFANGGFRATRVVHVCERHAEDEPLRTPRDTTKRGTSRLRPQEEALF